jgi:hypothetical protein
MLEPLELVSWVLEGSQGFPVEVVADVVVQRDQLSVRVSKWFTGLVNERQGVVSPVLELVPLCHVRVKEVLPGWQIAVNGCVFSWNSHFDNILGVSVVIADSWINPGVWE